MHESFEIKEVFQATAEEIYNAWLDSELHGKMTGGDAECSTVQGDPFYAWNGYISGRNIELIPNQKIVQSWRTTEFTDQDEDSLLTILLNHTDEGCELTLRHEHIPEGQTQYEQGWVDNYFEPMKEFFETLQ